MNSWWLVVVGGSSALARLEKLLRVLDLTPRTVSVNVAAASNHYF